MTTDDEMDAAGFLCKLKILFKANVSEGNNASDVFLIGKEVDSVLDGLDGVREGCALVRLGYVGGCLGGDSDEADVVLREDVVGNKDLVEAGVGRVDICSNDREIQLLDLFDCQ